MCVCVCEHLCVRETYRETAKLVRQSLAIAIVLQHACIHVYIDIHT